MSFPLTCSGHGWDLKEEKMRRASRRVFCAAVASTIAAILPGRALADTVGWNGIITGEWTNPANWGPFAEPGTGDQAGFGPVFAFRTNVNLDSDRTVGSM